MLPLETAGNPDALALAELLRREMMRRFCSEISPRCEAEFVIEASDAAERILAYARENSATLSGSEFAKLGS